MIRDRFGVVPKRSIESHPSLPEDADAAASNVAVSSVFRVAEADDFARAAEGYWEGECKQFCRTY